MTPASDRYVPLDHNSRELSELKVKLDDAIEGLRGINEEIDTETAVKIIELEAGRRLLEADRTNVALLEPLVLGALKFLSKRAFSVTVDALILAALTAAANFFGLL